MAQKNVRDSRSYDAYLLMLIKRNKKSLTNLEFTVASPEARTAQVFFNVQNMTFGVPVTGLSLVDFTITRYRLDSGALVAAAETMTLTGQGGGDYTITFTPSAVNAGYWFRIVPTNAQYVVTPSDVQFVS